MVSIIENNSIIHCVLNKKDDKKSNLALQRKIGIPRYVLYSREDRVFQNIFTLLGFSVFVSDITRKKTIFDGEAFCGNGASLPVKVMSGQILELVPTCKIICVLFPVPFEIKDLLEKLKRDGKEVLIIKSSGEHPFEQISKVLNVPLLTLKKTYSIAFNKKTSKNSLNTTQSKPTILFWGYPFILHDSFISHNIVSKIKSLGFETTEVENLGDFSKTRVTKENLKGIINFFSNSIEATKTFENKNNIPMLTIVVENINDGNSLRKEVENFIFSL